LVLLRIVSSIQSLESPPKPTCDQAEKDCSVQEFGESGHFVERNAEHLDFVIFSALASTLLSFLFFFSDGHFLIELLDELHDVFLVGSQWGVETFGNASVVDGFEEVEEVSWVEIGVLNE
jgi:hypothetical protein